LEARVGIRIDILTPRSLPATFRSKVLAEAIPI
jgi:predicted nucleotidyltransferase